MTILYEERSSDSPYIETITRGWTVSDGSTIRPAEINWHMVFVTHNGRVQPVFVGPLTTAGAASWEQGAEILWIKFKLGSFMPHLPARDFLDVETNLPGAASRSFWLKSSAWEFPNYENADTFIDRLVHDEVLVWDPIVNAALQDHTGFGVALRAYAHHAGLAREKLDDVRRVLRRYQKINVANRLPPAPQAAAGAATDHVRMTAQ